MEKTNEGINAALSYPLFDAILKRRSRRFGLGMELESKLSLGYKSKVDPIPLSEVEEALLIWAAAGFTGINLGDLPPEGGIGLLLQWVGRTYPSACNAHATELFYTNDFGLYMVKVRDAKAEELSVFEGLSREETVERILKLFHKYRIKLEDGRAKLPDEHPGLFEFNLWNANKPGTTLIFPITNTTIWYIDLLHLYCSKGYQITLIDELNGGIPAGTERWVKKGYLNEKLKMSLYEFEKRVITGMTYEQAFICQNINLALEAMGLGGWTFTGFLPFYALGGSPKFKGLGFRFIVPEPKCAMIPTPVPVGKDGVFEAFCPPYYKNMDKAIDAWLDMKNKEWRGPFPFKDENIINSVSFQSKTTTEIVRDVCNYIHDTYGRFPAFIEPMYMRAEAQAQHMDLEFYDKCYLANAYTEMHKNHFKLWHPEMPDPFEGGK